MNLKVNIGLLMMVFCGGVAFAADAPAPKPVDVRDLMSVSQFHQAGLDKLSPDELQALNAWLDKYAHPVNPAVQSPTPAAALTPVPAPAAATGAVAFGGEMLPQPKSADVPDVLKTRILGEFDGWTGDTIFKLENGQVWVQAAPGTYETHLENPQITIKKMLVGYLLTIPGQGGTVFVKRIH